MEDKRCRICLVVGVKMYDLHVYPLDNYYGSIPGINTLLINIPSYACYECAALLKKLYLFKERCLHGQAIFFDLYHNTNETSQSTRNKLESLDRQKLQVNSGLSIHHVPPKNTIDIIFDEYEQIKVKQESLDCVLEANNGEYDIKIEDDYLALSTPMAASTDDDEPLAIHKTNKLLSKAKRKKSRKSKDKRNVKATHESESMKLETESEAALQLANRSTQDEIGGMKRRKTGDSVEEMPEGKVKKKRGPKTDPSGLTRDEIEMEEYVTIIKLSLDEQRDEITQRQGSSNYKNAPYKCDVCFKGFVNTDAFGHHMTKHSPKTGDVECSICRFRFSSRRALQKHAVNHEKKYACKSCDYVSKTTTQAKQHQKWHKGVTYKCQYCDEILTKWTSYLSHVRIKHPSEFICGVCGYSFVSRLGLAMHKTMMHKDVTINESKECAENPRAGPYCKECDVQFVSLESWKRHLVTSAKHTQSNKLSHGCRVCGETFKAAEELRLHHRRLHARKRPKNYGKKPSDIVWPAKCEHCHEQIPSARDYWAHFRRMHSDKKYPIKKSYICEICGKSFRGNAFLVYHKRTHFEERAYKCAQCPKSFFNRTNLQMHEKTHSDHRPYPCNICFKAFKLKGALDRHFRSHTGEKPYECELCGKAFGQSNSRKLHVRTVHLKQPAPYVSKSRLERRRATHHADKPTLPPVQQPAGDHIAHGFNY